MRKLSLGLFVIISILLLQFCQPVKSRHQLTIAISKAVPETSYENYIRWLKSIDSTIKIEEMYHLSIDSAMILMDRCDGLLLTGGTDIFPGKYGKPEDTVRCWAADFKRDSLELMLIDKAVNAEKPILGICRGHQILNVYFGGSLIVDIPQDFDTIVKHMNGDGYDCYHIVNIRDGSMLKEITMTESGEVNSAHHQAIDQIADLLKPVAFAEDGLIESVEYKDKTDKPFLLGVQWHPERLDMDNPLSGMIGRRFIHESRQYNLNHHEK